MKNNWQLVSFQFDKELELALQQQHLAAQFIALAGRYIVPPKADFSNINMHYSAEKEMLLGNRFENEIHLGLHLVGLEIHIFDKQDKTIGQIELNGKTFKQGLDELRLKLIDAGVDVSNLKNEQPYSLPTDSLTEDKFSTHEISALKNAMILRHNAEIITDLATRINGTEPVRIWPHHFDTGTFFATAQNKSGGAIQTIGLGWAMPDGMVNEPYFYLSFWSEKEIKNNSVLPSLETGNWMMPGWNGAVLRQNEIISENSAKNQYLRVKHFFEEGIAYLTEYLQKNNQ